MPYLINHDVGTLYFTRPVNPGKYTIKQWKNTHLMNQ